jgi:SpoVK/Ycf46/Vps4 family AAA+-type ATPase
MDDIVTSSLTHVRLEQPAIEEKKSFIAAMRMSYPRAQFDDCLADDDAARLSANTPNTGLETMMRASHSSGRRTKAREIVEQKVRDVIELSEGTLSVLDAGNRGEVELAGRNIERVVELMVRIGDRLLHGNPHIPANIILVGPPGTGKTDLALAAASRANVTAYRLNSPKGGVVGETERKATLQFRLLRSWTPNVGFVDEITEAMPLERQTWNGDNGATQAVMAALLSALSDEQRRGESLLIATTNVPWRMSEAMRSRFTFVPVLSPLREDYVRILKAIALRLDPRVVPENLEVADAANEFFNRGASPREVLKALDEQLGLQESLTSDAILTAARSLSGTSDRASAVYADLWALKVCTFDHYLPWFGEVDHYPFPQHVEGLVDRSSGRLDRRELDRRIIELAPSANV